MAFTKNEEAVSPVIGVILMVAITVILAAVIAAFVFGMAGNVQKTRMVAATVSQTGENIMVTYQGGSDDSSLSMMKIGVIWGNGTEQVDGPWYTILPDGGLMDTSLDEDKPDPIEADDKPSVGAVYVMTGYGSSAKDKVTVTGIFNDGSEQVILDTTV